MLKRIKWMLALSLLTGSLAALHAAPLAIGSAAPPFSLKNVDERMLSLSDFDSSKAVVVVFSCNHCPYAKAYQNRLIRLQKEYGPEGVQFVLINPNDPKKQPQDSFENMQKRAREQNYPFPYLFDATQQVAKAYGATRTPEVYLFGSGRTLLYQGRIDDNTEEKDVKVQDLKNALEMVIAGTPDQIATKQTKAFGCTIKWRDAK